MERQLSTKVSLAHPFTNEPNLLQFMLNLKLISFFIMFPYKTSHRTTEFNLKKSVAFLSKKEKRKEIISLKKAYSTQHTGSILFY